MKALIRIGVATMGVAAAVSVTNAAFAQGGYRYPYGPAGSVIYDRADGQRYGVEWDRRPGTDQYGSPAGNMAYGREIRLGAGTRSVGVAHNETVKFVFGNREFRWRFDTLREIDSFPLARIVPTDLAVDPNAMVYVNSEVLRNG